MVARREGPEFDSAVARLQRADSASTAIHAIQIWDSTGAVVFSTSTLAAGMDDTARRSCWRHWARVILRRLGHSALTATPCDTPRSGPFARADRLLGSGLATTLDGRRVADVD
jgi:hypothetical protein